MPKRPERSSKAQPTTPAGWALFLRWLAVGLLFVGGAVVITWPLASELGEGIPLGTEAVATVPLFNLWTLAWNVESAQRGYEGYWQAPIFHPTPDTFALSEPQPLAGLLAACLCSLGFSILSAYNLILLAFLALNGLLATALLRRLGLGWIPALSGGALTLVLPFTHQELGVLQLVPLAGVLAFADAGFRFAEAPNLRRGLGLGVALAFAYWLSAQVAVFCALAAIPAALGLGWSQLWRKDRGWVRIWGGLAAGVGLFFALAAPLLVAQTRATTDESRVRSLETVRKQSALPQHYRLTPWSQQVSTPGIETAERPSARAFWPGSLKVLLALAALAITWREPRWRRLAIVGSLVLGSAFLLSLGANLGVGESSLAGLLRLVPGLSQVRSFFRFALFAQLAVAFLAALALQRLGELAARRWDRRRAVAIGVLLALAMVLELRPVPGKIQPMPPLDLELPWIDWIEDNTEASDALAFVPFPEGRTSRDYLGTSQWMYWQIRHWRPMVNGYSGFFPAQFRELKKTMGTFPANDALLALRDAGVRYSIVHRSVIESSPPPDPNGPVKLRAVFRDEEHGLVIFELADAGL